MNDDTDGLNAAYLAWLDRRDYYELRGLYWDRDKWRYEPQYPEDTELGLAQFAPGAAEVEELLGEGEAFTNWEEF